MIDIIIHKKENGQLISYKGIDESFAGKHFFLSLLRKITVFSKSSFIKFARNNHFDFSIEPLYAGREKYGIKNLKIDPKYFEVSFQFDLERVDDNLLLFIIDLWYVFEQPSFIFFTERQNVETDYEFATKNMSWKNVINFEKCFILFKGIEDDVIWIGISKDLELISSNLH